MYLIFRVYSEKERPNESKDERSVFYGWTNKKLMLKMFFRQRDENKYRVFKTTIDEIARRLLDPPEKDTELDFLNLKSRNGSSLAFIATDNEVGEYENRIQEMFRELSSLSTIKGTGNYLEMFYNLLDPYSSALSTIGYIPPEIEAMFSTYSDAYTDSYSSIFNKVIYSAESFVKVMKEDL